MSTQPLLIEIGCEELPPKSLLTLIVSFADSVHALLNEKGIEAAYPSYFATPRRLTLLFDATPTQQPDKQIQRKGPAVNAAYDKEGNPTKAALGFAQSCGVAFDALEKLSTPQGEWLVFNANQKGVETLSLLPDIITQALHKLPIAKRMRWGSSTTEFVRPIHWILGLLGEKIIPGEIFGVTPARMTYGHRFHHPDAIEIKHPNEYITALRAAKVEPCVNTRCDSIRKQAEAKAQEVNGIVHIDAVLLEEVAALVEWPVALVGRFEKQFLDVPHEALISTMAGNQKYFPVLDGTGKMLPHFVFITNIESKDPTQIITGNEKVIRPRFSDAQFFFEQDKKQTLESRLPDLEKMMFHPKLGSLKDKSDRLEKVVRNITNIIGNHHLDDKLPEQAAMLCKTDLLTNMVFEFPELQGTMGFYYAHHDGLDEVVAHAIKEHYLPRFATDDLPKTALGQILALADRVDSLVGIFAISQLPTGDKDPFALRRAALGVLRILLEKNLSLDLQALFNDALDTLLINRPDIKCDKNNVIDLVISFVLDRLQNIYQEQGFTAEEFLVTRAQNLTNPVDFDAHIRAIHAVSQSPEIKALASANKRIANILAKVDSSFVKAVVNETLLTETAEQALFSALTTAQQKIAPLQASKNFEQMMLSLAELKTPVDAFFDNVMVNAEDMHIRNNRLNLLQALRELFLSVADISLLSVSK
jgi:glycyl-tRNA synthetase beta chain